MGCTASKAGDVKAATPATKGGEKPKLVFDFCYTYNEGRKDECNALLTRCIEYNKETKMFGDVLYSYSFKETEDGSGYMAQEVFPNAECCEKYFRNFENCPFMEELMTLAQMATVTKSEICGIKEEVEKAPTIAMYYPAEGSELTGSTTYTHAEPDTSNITPQFGWVK